MIRWFARRRELALIVIISMPLLTAVAVTVRAGFPRPQVHDEYSYLLAGDTLAHGRLTNPPHPMWPFFETYQVLQQPTYMSKYPPLQGLFLALGQVMTGKPIVGAWIAAALACAAAWWALAGFLPRTWALIGAGIAATHPMLLGWSGTYWGGAPAMIGGCLVFGAAARLTRPVAGRTTRNWVAVGAALGAGMVLLLNSRPYEGAVMTVLSAGWVFLSRRRRGGSRPRPIAPVAGVAAAAVVVAAGVAWTAYYNYRVTNRASEFPYMLYERQYAVTPVLIWLPPPGRMPLYHHAPMRHHYLEWELDHYRSQRTPAGLLRAMKAKLRVFLESYFQSPALAVAAIAAVTASRRDRRLRALVVMCLLFVPAVLSGVFFFARYTAPGSILFLAAAVGGLRHVRAGWPYGRRLALAVLIGHLASLAVAMASGAGATHNTLHDSREQFIAAAQASGQRHLVIVRPAALHHVEAVYNEADIDRAAVVWARDMGDQLNRQLLDYFKDRQASLLDLGTGQLRTPYVPGEPQPQP